MSFNTYSDKNNNITLEIIFVTEIQCTRFKSQNINKFIFLIKKSTSKGHSAWYRYCVQHF